MPTLFHGVFYLFQPIRIFAIIRRGKGPARALVETYGGDVIVLSSHLDVFHIAFAAFFLQ
jgi:hypothetical protein